jgi:hypothetical protein
VVTLRSPDGDTGFEQKLAPTSGLMAVNDIAAGHDLLLMPPGGASVVCGLAP